MLKYIHVFYYYIDNQGSVSVQAHMYKSVSITVHLHFS